MSRLYGIKVNEDRWGFREKKNKDNDYHSYELYDKLLDKTYLLNNIIGVEEVSSSEFLVYDKISEDDFRIRRLLADNSRFKVLFEKKFNKFDFITQNRVLFSYYDYKDKYLFSGIYSIKDNRILTEGNWLLGLPVETFKRKNKPEEKEIFVEDEISSLRFNNPKLVYSVDPNTLEPNSFVYSEIKNTSVPVETKEDIINYKNEEKKYVEFLEKSMESERKKKIDGAKKLLKEKKNH